MLLLKKLRLNNFLSHEDTDLTFTENENFLIDGASGAGKSSIFDAIIWALYGQGRADNRSLVRKGAKKGFVSLELVQRDKANQNGDSYKIVRSVTSTGKHALDVSILRSDGSQTAHPLTGVRELQEFIDRELVGASYLLFINSVAYVQGNSESFVSQTATKRKDLLLEIVKAEDYDKYYENARTALGNLTTEQVFVNSKISLLEANMASLTGRISNRDTFIKDVADNTAILGRIMPIKEDLERQRAGHSSIRQTVDMLTGIIGGAEADYGISATAVENKKEKLASRKRLQTILEEQDSYDLQRAENVKILENARVQLEYAAEKEAIRFEFNVNKPRVNDRQQEIKLYEDQIADLEKRKPCPSGPDCPYYSKSLEQIQFGKERISELNTLLDKEKKALSDWMLEESKLPPASDMRVLITDITHAESEIAAIDKQMSKFVEARRDLVALDVIEQELPDLEKKLAEKLASINKIKSQREEAEASLDPVAVNRITNQLRDITEEERQANDKISRATAGLEGIERDEKESEKISVEASTLRNIDMVAIQEKVRKIALIKEAFASKGIETMVIDYLLPKLEDRINGVLGLLSDFRVRLDTQRKSADGESIVEGLFITIVNEVGEEMPFEAYSGGEKLKISVSISEALATLQKVGFRLFDETFLGLDENSTESFAEVLEGLQKNFGQVLCISHLLQIKDMFDKKVIVSKMNGISNVK